MRIIAGLLTMGCVLWIMRDLLSLGLPGVIALLLLALAVLPGPAKD